MRFKMAAVLVAAAIGLSAGCDSAGKSTPITPAPTGPVELDVRADRTVVDFSDLAEVLDEAVTDEGLVDRYRLPVMIDRLNRQLALLEVTGPRSTPQLLDGEDAQLAWWLNARAAWCLWLLHDAGMPKRVEAAAIYDRAVPIDNQRLTLRQIDSMVADRFGWQAALAVPGATCHAGRMIREPFTRHDVDRRVRARWVERIDDPDRFLIDVLERKLRVPSPLWRYRQQLIWNHQKRYGTPEPTLITALLPLVEGSPRRRLHEAVGYEPVEHPPEGPVDVFRRW